METVATLDMGVSDADRRITLGDGDIAVETVATLDMAVSDADRRITL